MIILWILAFFFLLWVGYIVYTIIYFKQHQPTTEDQLFVSEEYSVTHCAERLLRLEKFVGRKLTTARAILKKYAKNAELTGRKFSYYRPLIEPGMVNIYMGAKRFNTFESKLDAMSVPFRLYFWMTFVICILAFATFSILLLYQHFLLFLIFLIPAIAATFVLFKISISAYEFIIDMLSNTVKGKNLGGVNRNLLIYRKLFIGLPVIGKRETMIIDGDGFYVGGGSYSGSGGGFGGFGGGSFGGGGAGGSW